MAFIHGKDAEVIVDGDALSCFTNNGSLSIDVDTSETSTFCVDWKTFVTGMAGASLTLDGYYDPTDVTGPAIILLALVGAAPFPVLWYPGGDTAGQMEHSFNAILTNYTETAGVADTVTFSATLLVTGPVASTLVGA